MLIAVHIAKVKYRIFDMLSEFSANCFLFVQSLTFQKFTSIVNIFKNLIIIRIYHWRHIFHYMMQSIIQYCNQAEKCCWNVRSSYLDQSAFADFTIFKFFKYENGKTVKFSKWSDSLRDIVLIRWSSTVLIVKFIW